MERRKTTKTGKSSAISKKVSQIMREGIRKNTRKPIGKMNKRRPVKLRQAVAVAVKMSGKK